MNYTKILIKQDGAYALPENTPCKWRGNRNACGNETCWDLKECQRNPPLLDNAVKFRNEETIANLKLWIRWNGHKDGELVSCPEGFEIVIENGYATLKNIK